MFKYIFTDYFRCDLTVKQFNFFFDVHLLFFCLLFFTIIFPCHRRFSYDFSSCQHFHFNSRIPGEIKDLSCINVTNFYCKIQLISNFWFHTPKPPFRCFSFYFCMLFFVLRLISVFPFWNNFMR